MVAKNKMPFSITLLRNTYVSDRSHMVHFPLPRCFRELGHNNGVLSACMAEHRGIRACMVSPPDGGHVAKTKGDNEGRLICPQRKGIMCHTHHYTLCGLMIHAAGYCYYIIPCYTVQLIITHGIVLTLYSRLGNKHATAD